MKTRSAKAAERQRIFSADYQDPDPSPTSETSESRKRRRSEIHDLRKELKRQKRKQKRPHPDDLGEERANPTKADYNHVRKALILAREEVVRKDAALKMKNAALEELTQDMEDIDRIITDKEDLRLKCIEIQDKIREVQDAGYTPRLTGHGLGVKSDDSDTMPPIETDSTGPEPTESIRNMLAALKTSIREFTYRYFSGKLHIPSVARLGTGWAQQYMQATTPGADTYMDYLHSRKRCPLIIEAFIWRFLCGNVFNNVPWGGNEDIRRHVSGLQGLLAQCEWNPDPYAFMTDQLTIWYSP